MSVDLKSLIAKLNDTTRGALEAAAGLCLSRTHYDVEVEHYLMKLLDSPDTDFARIMRAFEFDKSRFTAELMRSLDRLKTGNARTPVFSPSLIKMFTEAWSIGTLNYNAGKIRSGFLILALVSDDELARLMREVSKEFQKINGETLRKEFVAIIHGSKEDVEVAGFQPAAGGVAEMGTPGTMSVQNIFDFLSAWFAACS